MQSTEPIAVPDRIADVAVKGPTILHTDEHGEFLVMRDDGAHGRVLPGMILEAAGIAGPVWVRITSKRDYRVGAFRSGVGVVGVRFEPLTADEAYQGLVELAQRSIQRSQNRRHAGDRPPAKPDRRSQAEREAAGDDSPAGPTSRQVPRARPIGTQREPAPSEAPRHRPLTRPAGIVDQAERVTGPASSASTPPKHVPSYWD